MLHEKFESEELSLFSRVVHRDIKTEDQLLNILLNFNEGRIYSIINKVENLIRLELMNEIKSFNLSQCISFAKYLSIDSSSKQYFISKFDDYPIHEIKRAINEINENTEEEYIYVSTDELNS